MAKRGNRFGLGVNGKHIFIGIVVLVLIGIIVWACVYDPANLFGKLQAKAGSPPQLSSETPVSSADADFYKQMSEYLPSNNGNTYSNSDLRLWLPGSWAEMTNPSTGHPSTGISSGCKQLWARNPTDDRTSVIFTWVSKKYMTPVLAGYISCGQRGNCSTGPSPAVEGRPCGSAFGKCEWNGMENDNFDSMRGNCKFDKDAMGKSYNTNYYQKGHMVGDKIVKMQWGQPEQTYSMCNIGFQTKSLNYPKWNHLEEWEASTFGSPEWDPSYQQRRGVVLTGPLPPFKSDPFNCIGTSDQPLPPGAQANGEVIPVGFFKIVTLLDAGPDQRGKTYVFWWNNDCDSSACDISQGGEDALKYIESATGFSFPSSFIRTIAPKDDMPPGWVTDDDDTCSETQCELGAEYGDCVQKLWKSQNCSSIQ